MVNKLKPLKVHAVGSYGMRNFGDDLFVDTISERSNDIWPNAVVKTFVPNNLKTYSSNTLIGKSLRFGTAIVGFFWADTVALCGGSILQDVRGVARLRQRFLSMKRVQAFGVSVGPFFDAAAGERVREFVNHLDKLIVRDNASVNRFAELQTQCQVPLNGGDLVALNSKTIPRSHKFDDGICICPSAASKIPYEILLQQVIEGLKFVEDTLGDRPKVKILALAASEVANDGPLTEQLHEALQAHGYDVRLVSYASNDLENITSEIANSSMVWSQRLHGGIVSYLTDVPFLLVGHHAKCLDFAEDIGLDLRTLVGSKDSWVSGIEVLLRQGKQAEMSSQEYRIRAERTYTAVPEKLVP